jgi:EAL domain-containing protein (putative c-di-GMP-specific phosphodiesterase class I)
METVAECVETQVTRASSSAKWKYLQGYYFGRPSMETPAPVTLNCCQIVQSTG